MPNPFPFPVNAAAVAVALLIVAALLILWMLRRPGPALIAFGALLLIAGAFMAAAGGSAFLTPGIGVAVSGLVLIALGSLIEHIAVLMHEMHEMRLALQAPPAAPVAVEPARQEVRRIEPALPEPARVEHAAPEVVRVQPARPEPRVGPPPDPDIDALDREFKRALATEMARADEASRA